jgi:MFS family permease
MLSRAISPEERGLYMGVQQFFGGTTRVFFPLCAGWLYDHINPSAPFWAASAVVAGTLFLGVGLEAAMRSEFVMTRIPPSQRGTQTPT